MKSLSKKPSQPSREDLLKELRDKQAVDPVAAMNPRALAKRLGIPVAVVWVIAFLIPGWISKAVVGVLTLILLGVVIWAMRFAKKSRAVANIVRDAVTAEERKEAISKLESEFKKDDVAAVFAKAQLQMQESPREALLTLETIRLDKVMAPMADEARAQRAMIHMILGETDEARALVDKIDLSRHKESKTRATLAAIVGEALARTGDPKRAVEMLETFDINDELYSDLRAQLLRARAFAYAWANNTKEMKHVLRTLSGMNPQYLSGFVTKKKHPMGVSPRGVHPLLEKEAFDMLMRSGTVSRKMEFRRG